MTLLKGIRVCVFDAYGTIFDFASAAGRCSAIPEQRRSGLTALWREKQLQYTWLRALQGRYVDFWQVTSDALDFAIESMDLERSAHAELMELYRTLQAFPEVPNVLHALRDRGFATAILSNGSPEMLHAAVAGSGLDALFDAVLSVDAVGTFKTHPTVYQYAVDQLGVSADGIAFQSSNAWDAYAASDFGFHVVWCNRYVQRRERLPGQPDREIRSLSELPELLDWPPGSR